MDILNIGNYSQEIVSGNTALEFINPTNTILLAICTALVFFMLPGLAFFYAGLLRKKNVVTLMQQVFASAAIVTLIWITFGFSLAFGTSLKGIIGDIREFSLFRNIFFTNGWETPTNIIVNKTIAAGVPFALFFMFQLAFAVITPALVVGAFADRLTWRGYVIFNILFTIFIYIPACHWIWGGGFLAQWGAIDWAGGIVIHATCGLAAVGSVIILGRRKVLLKESLNPHNIPLIAIGAAILFFGWFGFNVGGSTYLPINDPTQTSVVFMIDLNKQLLSVGVSSFANSFIAMAMGMFVWIVFDWIFRKKTSFVGLLTGAIAGLATITPTAGYVAIWASVPIGVLGGIVTYGVAKLFHHIHFDDALEVFPIHGVGGLVGSLILGALIAPSINPNVPIASAAGGIVPTYGSLKIFISEAIACGIVSGWTLVITLISFVIIKYLFLGQLRYEEQIQGVDNVVHNESAYGDEYNIDNILNGVGENLMWSKEKTTISKKINNLLNNYQINDQIIDEETDIYLNRNELIDKETAEKIKVKNN